ncbi:MAG: hypothetical protein M9963_10490 [Kiritimatiellae bacterium]|nr:hypothetical protein [Kiritimatiellia bacterium]MCO5062403.1 hypothetical protein [Kiritimatiellia bacterium]MCO6400619.1 hypothetical protein [Verrucomicrobiota bacterium]
MSIFDFFKFGRRKEAPPNASKPPSNETRSRQPAAQTAPGLRAIRHLWDINKPSAVERVTGSIATDIYANQHAHGFPRRKHPVRRPRNGGDTGSC